MATNQTQNKASDRTERKGRNYFEIPTSWLDAGQDADPDDGELLFMPDRGCLEVYEHYERQPHGHVDVSESAAIYVLYRNDTTGESIERRYRAALRSNADGLGAVPKCLHNGSPNLFKSSLAVPRSEVVDE